MVCFAEAREGEASKGSPIAEEDPEIAEKIDLFKAKISRNAAVVPITLKRMNDCIAAINKLDRCNDAKWSPQIIRKNFPWDRGKHAEIYEKNWHAKTFEEIHEYLVASINLPECKINTLIVNSKLA
ncbi:hypothetical protein QJS10_CPA06g00296 [Acorus calamus]|uniref:Uncharacterized protein n=1 Tax=Acorus calamus TaxID=4465 RepID=A0AAV9EL87_ACOCL|nr:hypothetical protein QJS10_CPA06g00296 [Acorus calamus]